MTVRIAGIALCVMAAISLTPLDAQASCRAIDPAWDTAILHGTDGAELEQGRIHDLLGAANTLKALGDESACHAISRALLPGAENTATRAGPLVIVPREREEPREMAYDDDGLATFRPGRTAQLPTAGIVSAVSMISAPVRNTDDRTVGEIENLILSDTGKPAYVVVGYGGFLGLGEKLIAVPFARVRPSADGKRFYIGMSDAEIEAAPAFDPGRFFLEPR